MKLRSTSVALFLTFVCAGLIHAGPLSFQSVPHDAKWLAHVDAEAMQSSAVMKELWTCLEKTHLGELIEKKMLRCWGMDSWDDLRGITLYGTKIARGHCVMIIRGDMDAEKLAKEAKKASDYRTMKQGDFTIHAWTEKKYGKNQEVAGTFYKNGVLVLAAGPDLLKKALSVLKGDAETLEKGEGPLVKEIPAGTIFLARATKINESPVAEEHPLCAQLVSLCYAEGQHGDEWFDRVSIRARNEDVARRLETIAEGIGAFWWLHLKESPKLRGLLDQCKVERDGDAINVRFGAPAEKVAAAMPEACDLVEKCWAKHRATQKSRDVSHSEEHPKKEKPEEAKPDKRGTDKKRRDAAEVTARQGTPVLGVVIGKPMGKDAAEVVRVWEDGPAAKAGLKPGDRIVEVNGEAIDSPEKLRMSVLRQKPGSTVDLLIHRDGQEMELEAKLSGGDGFVGSGDREGMHRLLSPRPWLGVRIGSGAGRGVGITGVLPGSPADLAGVQPGDSVIRVDETRVEAATDLQAAIAGYRPGETVRLTVLRDDVRREIEVELGAFGIWEGTIDAEPRKVLKWFLEGRLPLEEDDRGEEEQGGNSSNQ